MRDIVALFFSFYQSSYVIKRDKEGKRVSLNAPILDYICRRRGGNESKRDHHHCSLHIYSPSCWSVTAVGWLMATEKEMPPLRCVLASKICGAGDCYQPAQLKVLRGRWPCFPFSYRAVLLFPHSETPLFSFITSRIGLMIKYKVGMEKQKWNKDPSDERKCMCTYIWIQENDSLSGWKSWSNGIFPSFSDAVLFWAAKTHHADESRTSGNRFPTWFSEPAYARNS